MTASLRECTPPFSYPTGVGPTSAHEHFAPKAIFAWAPPPLPLLATTAAAVFFSRAPSAPGPQNVAVANRSATVWQLAAAALIDATPELAAGAVAAIIVKNGSESANERTGDPHRKQQQALADHGTAQGSHTFPNRIWLCILAYNLARAGALIATEGRTPGTALLGMKVVRSDGAPVGIASAFVRISGLSWLVSPLLRPLLSGTKLGTRVAADAALAAANVKGGRKLVHFRRLKSGPPRGVRRRPRSGARRA